MTRALHSPSSQFDRNRRPIAIELFCGAGGMALGFEQAGFDILAAVDLDPVHLAAHERNFPLCEPLCADIAELHASDIAAAAQRGWRNRHPQARLVAPVDCVFGGPSCQGFSVIGSRDRKDPRNDLVSEFARLVLELRPRWFVMENVPGLVSLAYRPVLDELYAVTRAAGYCVAEPWVLNARDHGVPQERKRVFVVGARRGETLPSQPTGTGVRVSVAEALNDLPVLSRLKSLLKQDSLDLTDAQLKAMLARQSPYVRALNSPQGDLADRRRWDPGRLSSVGLTIHRSDVVARFRDVRPGERDEVGRLPKLEADGQSPTLRAGTGRDHGSFTSARPIHHRSPRVISVREAARLHGFPDWFGFHATKWQGFRQVGNSVPPPLARAVAAEIVVAAGLEPPRRSGRPLALGADLLLEMALTEAAGRYGLDRAKLPADVRRNHEKKRAEAA